MHPLLSYQDIIKIGDERLYQVCEPITQEDTPHISGWVKQLHKVLFEVKDNLGFGRGIAAPQMGIMKRLVYIHMGKPMILINPVIVEHSAETFRLWDDCMSIPNILVHVERAQSIKVRYHDMNWTEHELTVTDPALSELLQHEIDHLDGILCTMRAIDNKSMKYRPTPS